MAGLFDAQSFWRKSADSKQPKKYFSYFVLMPTHHLLDHGNFTIYTRNLINLKHIYIIGHYNPLVMITTQFLTTLMLCALILYMSGGTYTLKSTPNDRFLRKFFMAIIFTFRVFARNLLKDKRRKILFVFCFDAWPGARSLSFPLIGHHTTYQTTATTSSSQTTCLRVNR